MRFGVPRASFICSSICPSIKNIYKDFQDSSQWLPCKNSSLNFWTDNFLGYTIADKLGIPLSARRNLGALIHDVYWDGDWHISPTFGASFLDVVNDLHNVIFSVNTSDHFAWRFSSNGVFATKWAFDFFRSSSPKVAWGRDLWRHYLPPSRSFLCWRAFLYCLPTADILQHKGMCLVSICHLCFHAHESIDHVLINCPYAVALWSAL